MADTAPETTVLPDKYCKCGCCAISCTDCEKCCGCKAFGHGCCLEGECFCCKPVENEDVCCVFNRSLTKCVGCALYDVYQQCCCCECIFSCCCHVEDVYATAPTTTSVDVSKVGMPKPEDVNIFAGLCCSLMGFYCSCPEIFGISLNSTMLCLQNAAICCKYIGKDSDNTDYDACCLFSKTECLCVPVKTCVKCECQKFCLFGACAVPCDEDVPCVLGHFGAVCCVNWGCAPACCPKLQHIYEVVNPQKYSDGKAADGSQA